MGAKIVKGIILACAMVAVFAAAGGASFYTYETWWAYMLPPCYYVYRAEVAGDASGLVVPIEFYEEGGEFEVRLYCFKFDAEGSKKKEWLLESAPTLSCLIGFCDLVPFNGDLIITYSIFYNLPPGYCYDTLRRFGSTNWKLIIERFASEELRFGALAAPAKGNFYYCWRYHEGAKRVCKSPGTSVVVSYFTPHEKVLHCMAADGQGYVFTSYQHTITKYHDSGSVLKSWNNPEFIKTLTLDPEGRLLAFSADKYTYVYNVNGSLLGSFTAPYFTDIHSATMGPEGKYYVMGSAHGRTTMIIYRFAPGAGPINVQPTSFGKIKAMYK